ncbi:hypothetical protein GTA09_31235 [Rhodococcus hoagii]|nr:hypothetical protein [Prescottella equi]
MIEPDSLREAAPGRTLPIGHLLHLGIRHPELPPSSGGNLEQVGQLVDSVLRRRVLQFLGFLDNLGEQRREVVRIVDYGRQCGRSPLARITSGMLSRTSFRWNSTAPLLPFADSTIQDDVQRPLFRD